MESLLDELKAKGLCRTTNRRIDLKHLLSAERAARGSFYATRVGFVAINPRGLRIARAQNGFPVGVRETRERWSKTQKDYYHLHAECGGIFHAARHGYATKGASAYVTHPPCPGCMRVLITAGFSRVVFSEQSLFERHDWREDMIRTFHLAHEHAMELLIYRDKERSLKDVDITRTELQLKKVYDDLVPEARWSSADKSAISPPAKPESPDWIDHPVITHVLAAARNGVALDGGAAILDFLPECRATTALLQAGIREIWVREYGADTVDPRWGNADEIAVAAAILKNEAMVPVLPLDEAVKREGPRLPVALDATRSGVKMPGLSLIRITS